MIAAMLYDVLLATMHHLLAILLVGFLVTEAVLLRLAPDRSTLTMLARVDMTFGIMYGLLLLVGIAHLVFSTKGIDYYLVSLTFWIKMAAFVSIGLMSIKPAVSFLYWEHSTQLNESLPGAAEWAGMRRWVHAELALFPLLLFMAALMARGIS